MNSFQPGPRDRILFLNPTLNRELETCGDPLEESLENTETCERSIILRNTKPLPLPLDLAFARVEKGFGGPCSILKGTLLPLLFGIQQCGIGFVLCTLAHF